MVRIVGWRGDAAGRRAELDAGVHGRRRRQASGDLVYARLVNGTPVAPITGRVTVRV